MTKRTKKVGITGKYGTRYEQSPRKRSTGPSVELTAKESEMETNAHSSAMVPPSASR